MRVDTAVCVLSSGRAVPASCVVPTPVEVRRCSGRHMLRRTLEEHNRVAGTDT